MTTILETLRPFGITRCYKGFPLTVYAIHLAVMEEDRLEEITEKIYRETADHFGCKWTGFLCRTCLPDGPVDFLGNNRPSQGMEQRRPDYRAALGRWRTKASMRSTLSSWERMASFWPGVQASKKRAASRFLRRQD